MSSAVARSLRSAPASARRLPGRAVLSRARSTAAVGVADDAEPQGSLFNPTAEHYALRELCAAFVRDEVEPQALEFNRAERFNHPLFRRAGELGLLGVTVDPEYGGAGMDAAAACIVHEELSASDPAFCLSYLAHSQLFVNNLARNGSAEQKAAWLPAACSGEAIGGMGMSEPEAGTDVLGMRTRAEQQADGSWLLNGGKMWITNGAVSDTELGDRYLIYARTGGPAVKASKAVSLFYVERGMAGFSLGQRLKDKCGMRASPTAELVFENVPLPAANLIGQPGGATVCMMRNLEIERVVLAAMGVGIARRSLEAPSLPISPPLSPSLPTSQASPAAPSRRCTRRAGAVNSVSSHLQSCEQAMNAYATDRRAFGASLRDFGQIQRHIAESYAEYMAGKTYLYQTALGLDLDAAGNRLDTDGVKLYCTTMGKNVADRAIQVMGGYGYMGEYAVERLWRDAKLLEIGGGTLESHHKNMVRDMSQLDAMP